MSRIGIVDESWKSTRRERRFFSLDFVSLHFGSPEAYYFDPKKKRTKLGAVVVVCSVVVQVGIVLQQPKAWPEVVGNSVPIQLTAPAERLSVAQIKSMLVRIFLVQISPFFQLK